MRSVIIIAKKNSVDAEEAALKVSDLLKSRKMNVYCVSPLRMDNCKTVDLANLAHVSAEFIIAIGGDGTTLRAFRTLPRRVPLLSVNVGGHRGILSEIDTGSLEEGIRAMLDGKCDLDCRIRIQGSIEKENLPPALNDILITRKNITRTPVVSIRLMNDQIHQRMDGLLVSTPTGSTGHSLSIGGPVIHERMDCLVLCPIAAVNRIPLMVIPVQQIYVTSNRDSQVVVDGQEVFELPAGQSITLTKYADDACFLRLRKKGLRQLDKLGF
jgi:NAD+ kinase